MEILFKKLIYSFLNEDYRADLNKLSKTELFNLLDGFLEKELERLKKMD